MAYELPQNLRMHIIFNTKTTRNVPESSTFQKCTCLTSWESAMDELELELEDCRSCPMEKLLR